MTVRPLRLLLSILGTLATACTASVPLYDGEQLTYRVSWAIVPGAGDIKISGREDRSGPTPKLIVTTTTATRRLARLLLPFDAEGRSVFDLQTGKLISLEESSNQKGKQNSHTVTFNYETRKATYTGGKTPGEVRELDMPDGDPMDLMLALLQTRTWDLKPGEKRDALVLFDDDFYELTIHMARYENVSTSLGQFRTIVLEPRMDKTPPKGMFRRGSSVRIWIAQDRLRLPVKFEVEFKIGTGTATLEAYVPPAKERAANGAHPRS
jgi:hypothetical protein